MADEMQYRISVGKEARPMLSMKPIAEGQMRAATKWCIECVEDGHGPWLVSVEYMLEEERDVQLGSKDD